MHPARQVTDADVPLALVSSLSGVRLFAQAAIADAASQPGVALTQAIQVKLGD